MLVKSWFNLFLKKSHTTVHEGMHAPMHDALAFSKRHLYRRGVQLFM